MYILAWKVARLVCSALSTVLDMLRPLIVAWPSPVQLRIMNGRKMTRVASSAISVCWWFSWGVGSLPPAPPPHGGDDSTP